MKITLLILIAFVTSCSHTKKSDRLAKLYLRLGTSHLVKKQYPSALKELLKSLEIDSENPKTHNNLAITYYSRNQLPLAVKHFEKALELDPKFTEVRNNLGRIYISQKKWKKAIEILTIATEDLTYSSPEQSYHGLGLVYLETKKYPQAKTYFQKALSMKPDFCPAHSSLGKTLYYQGAYSAALNVFAKRNQNCSLEQKMEISYYRGLSLLKLKRTKTAILEFNHIITERPSGIFASRAKKVLNILNRKKSYE